MNKALLSALAALAAAAAAGGGYWYGALRSPVTMAGGTGAHASTSPGAGAANRAAAVQEAIAVAVARVSAVQLPETITAVGSLRSDESVTLRPETNSIVRTLPVVRSRNGSGTTMRSWSLSIAPMAVTLLIIITMSGPPLTG